MNHRLTHREFIEAIVDDTDRFERLLKEFRQCTGIALKVLDRSCTGASTRNECMRGVLMALESAPGPFGYSDLDRLKQICDSSLFVLGQLNNSDLWKKVLSRVPIGSEGPVSVTPLLESGRCNYLYKIKAGKQQYVVRYLDTIGREFLQRYDPTRAIKIYLAAEELFGICLGTDGVVNTLYPSHDIAAALGPVDEDSAPIGEILLHRIMIQPDYSIDHFLLADYASQVPTLSLDQVVRLFARPIARLHGSSTGLFYRAQGNVTSDSLATVFKRFTGLLRFPDAVIYGKWLSGMNWITRQTLAALENPRGPGPVWTALLRRIDCTAGDFIHSCYQLWGLSALAAEQLGCLVHFDHKPRNCFVDRATATRARLLDFDYVALADPAYEAGLSANAIVQLATSGSCGEKDSAVSSSILHTFMEAYQHSYYQSIPLTQKWDSSLPLRAGAFSALAMAVSIKADGFSASRSEALLESAAKSWTTFMEAGEKLILLPKPVSKETN